MSTYHQMGHDSENLLSEAELGQFKGAILSPVNYEIAKVASQIAKCREESDLETVFDPQLYVPTSERNHLPGWNYFPRDVDSADLDSDAWWQDLVERLADTCTSIKPDSIVSPIYLPRIYTDNFFARSVDVCKSLLTVLDNTDIQTLQTVVVGLNDLAAPGRALTVASIISGTKANKIYLVLDTQQPPRRELADTEGIKGAMRLIAALTGAGLKMLVGFCASDIVLWKHAGATDCASGKFFNLRRFTRSRFDDAADGGGLLPYWFEENLLGFLREPDLLRVQKENLLSDASQTNPFGQSILRKFKEQPGSPWVAESWRQFLWWFADVEHRIESGQIQVPKILRDAERRWLSIEDRILMDERRNDGDWLRSWRRACIEFTADE